MATFTARGTGYDEATAATVTTASITWSGALVGICSVVTFEATANPTMTGGGLTWTRIASIAIDANMTKHMFVGTGTASNGTLAISATGLTWASWDVTSVIDCNLTTPVIPGSTTTASGTGTTPLVTLPAFENALNTAFGACTASDSTNLNAGASWTGLTDWQDLFDGLFSVTQYRVNDNSVDFTSSGSVPWFVIGFELDQAAAAGGSVTTKTMTETFTFNDARVSGARRPRALTDSVSFADEARRWRRCFRWVNEAIATVDQAVKTLVSGSGVFTKVMSDTLGTVDGFFRYLRRRRDGSEVISISEGGTFRQFLITGSDSFETADGFVQWRRLRRLMTESVDIIDGFSKTLAGASIVYARVMSETITLIDDAGNRWKLRTSQLTDAVGLNDQVIRYLRRIRTLGDDVEYSDGTVKIRRSARMVDESIDVSDQQISTHILDQVSSVNFKFGASGPPFRFGGV